MIKKSLILLVLFTISFFNPIKGQERANNLEKSDQKLFDDFKNRIFFGGNVGAQFGNYTFVDFSPLVGYRISDKLSVGVGITYNYLRFRYGKTEYKTDIYGGRVFGRYFVWENLFLHGEYEVLNGAWDYTNKRFNIENILGGAGYRQMVTDRAAMTLLVLWNFSQNNYSPYSNPIIRGGFTFGF